MGQAARTETEGDAVLNPRPPMTVRLWRHDTPRIETTIPYDVGEVLAVAILIWLAMINLWMILS